MFNTPLSRRLSKILSYGVVLKIRSVQNKNCVYLQADATGKIGKEIWIYQLTLDGVMYDLQIGEHPNLSLADAIKGAATARKILNDSDYTIDTRRILAEAMQGGYIYANNGSPNGRHLNERWNIPKRAMC